MGIGITKLIFLFAFSIVILTINCGSDVERPNYLCLGFYNKWKLFRNVSHKLQIEWGFHYFFHP